MYQNIDPELNNAIQHIGAVELFVNGRSKKINREEKWFSTIYAKIVDILSEARVMPAYGVSIHDEVVSAKKIGVWIEIHFDQECKINGLPFTSLLIRVEQGFGFNLIRKYNDQYEGRAIYLAFDQEIDLLDEFVKNS